MPWFVALGVILPLLLAPGCASSPRTPAAPTVVVPDVEPVQVDGRAFFPVGLYHVSWNIGAAELRADLRAVAAAGFNTIHASRTATNDYGAFLDEAARLGVKVITESDRDLPATVALYKDHPAVLGWNIADDVDDGRHSHDQVLQTYRQIKVADPAHPTYISGFRPPGTGSPTIGDFVDSADLIAMQSYPVDKGTLGDTSRAVADVVDAGATARRPVIANVQAHVVPGGGRPPSPAEVRNMSYQSLAAGAKGIIYYTYRDGRNYLPAYPALWGELQALVPEMNALAPVVTGGALSRLNTSVADTSVSYWRYGGRVYVVALNTSTASAKNVSLPMPAGTRGPARPLFAGRPDGLSFADGRLSGTIGPGDVHVYVLDEATSVPAPLPPSALGRAPGLHGSSGWLARQVPRMSAGRRASTIRRAHPACPAPDGDRSLPRVARRRRLAWGIATLGTAGVRRV